MSEIKHYGVKGMKWGVRRYQNADGSRKPAGKKRERKGGSLKTKYVNAMDRANAKSAAGTAKRRAAIKSAPKKALSGYKNAMEKADAKSAAGTAKRKAAIKSAPKKALSRYKKAKERADAKKAASRDPEHSTIKEDRRKIRAETSEKIKSDIDAQVSREVQAAVSEGNTKKIQEIADRTYGNFDPVINSETSKKLVEKYGSERIEQFERSEARRDVAKVAGILAVTAGSGIALATIEDRV